MYVYKKRSLIFIFSIIDLIGTILAWPFKAFGRKKRDVFARIAVIRIDHVGDVIMSTCVLGPLRKTHPASAIDMVVPSWAYDIVKSSPDITKAMLFDPVWFDRKVRARFFAQARGVFALARLLKAGRYDAVVDLRGDFRHILAMWLSGAKRRISCGVTGGAFLLTDVVPYSAHAHQTERNLSLLGPLGVPADSPQVSLDVLSHAERKAEGLLRANGIIGPYAVIHTSPGHNTKVWDPEGFLQVAEYLKERKKAISVFIGAPKDSHNVRDIISRLGDSGKDLCGKTDLETLIAIVRNASFFIGVDSAPAHIASAFNVPGVVLFSGVNDPEEWAPIGGGLRVVYPGKGRDLSSVTPRDVCEAIDHAMGKGAIF